MRKINSKIYYETSTGNILEVTPECEGDAIETTKEEDLKYYEKLKNKSISEIDYITLEFGTLLSIFNNAKYYKINLETKKLEVTYYTKEELEEQRNQYEQQAQEN